MATDFDQEVLQSYHSKIVEACQVQTEQVRNNYGIWVNKGCMSCQHKKYQEDIRFCRLTEKEVTSRFICPQWELSDGMKNAGLNNGGKVRLRGTKEVIIG